MTIKFKKTNPKAVMPFKAHDDDFCYDCVAVSCEEIAPNVYKYGLGFALQIDRDETSPFCFKICKDEHKKLMEVLEAWQLSVDIRPRSSIYKTGMVLSNSVGTVDVGYTGEISAIFYHVLPSMPKYEVGDKVCQMKLGFTLPVEFIQVIELCGTERGSNGYGSSGK